MTGPAGRFVSMATNDVSDTVVTCVPAFGTGAKSAKSIARAAFH